MPNFTPNFNLKKPLENENYNVNDVNGNMDIIDNELEKAKNKIDLMISESLPPIENRDKKTLYFKVTNTVGKEMKIGTNMGIKIVE